MLHISSHVAIPDSEIDIHAMRSQGAGGQNVNKVSSAIHLQFDIAASSLPPFYKEELLKLKDNRISEEGVVTIKAQQYRSQEQNREDALTRLRGSTFLAWDGHALNERAQPSERIISILLLTPILLRLDRNHALF